MSNQNDQRAKEARFLSIELGKQKIATIINAIDDKDSGSPKATVLIPGVIMGTTFYQHGLASLHIAIDANKHNNNHVMRRLLAIHDDNAKLRIPLCVQPNEHRPLIKCFEMFIDPSLRKDIPEKELIAYELSASTVKQANEFFIVFSRVRLTPEHIKNIERK